MVKHARIGDPTYGYCDVHESEQPGTITSGSSTVFAEGIGMATEGDEVTAACGHKGIINSGSSITSISNRSAARENDTFSGIYHGSITGGSALVGTV